ncbi:hypothetical protein BESB_048090 [Besnoitia besnoiti]|uniref:DUF2428 domain-containing protein n=1 Tax=Besnoitia besnoiti TaxID=94643 RepID=A0A2A9MLQ7_BESBE|nr:hypothetical protein BESB_048090 [Besnoitia besnoiti]PFH36617.1 hypothetical protein BESB_048090 [Besnoitia besnoiti]
MAGPLNGELKTDTLLNPQNGPASHASLPPSASSRRVLALLREECARLGSEAPSPRRIDRENCSYETVARLWAIFVEDSKTLEGQGTTLKQLANFLFQRTKRIHETGKGASGTTLGCTSEPTIDVLHELTRPLVEALMDILLQLRSRGTLSAVSSLQQLERCFAALLKADGGSGDRPHSVVRGNDDGRVPKPEGLPGGIENYQASERQGEATCQVLSSGKRAGDVILERLMLWAQERSALLRRLRAELNKETRQAEDLAAVPPAEQSESTTEVVVEPLHAAALRVSATLESPTLSALYRDLWGQTRTAGADAPLSDASITFLLLLTGLQQLENGCMLPFAESTGDDRNAVFLSVLQALSSLCTACWRQLLEDFALQRLINATSMENRRPDSGCRFSSSSRASEISDDALMAQLLGPALDPGFLVRFLQQQKQLEVLTAAAAIKVRLAALAGLHRDSGGLLDACRMVQQFLTPVRAAALDEAGVRQRKEAPHTHGAAGTQASSTERRARAAGQLSPRGGLALLRSLLLLLSSNDEGARTPDAPSHQHEIQEKGTAKVSGQTTTAGRQGRGAPLNTKTRVLAEITRHLIIFTRTHDVHVKRDALLLLKQLVEVAPPSLLLQSSLGNSAALHGTCDGVCISNGITARSSAVALASMEATSSVDALASGVSASGESPSLVDTLIEVSLSHWQHPQRSVSQVARSLWEALGRVTLPPPTGGREGRPSTARTATCGEGIEHVGMCCLPHQLSLAVLELPAMHRKAQNLALLSLLPTVGVEWLLHQRPRLVEQLLVEIGDSFYTGASAVKLLEGILRQLLSRPIPLGQTPEGVQPGEHASGSSHRNTSRVTARKAQIKTPVALRQIFYPVLTDALLGLPFGCTATLGSWQADANSGGVTCPAFAASLLPLFESPLSSVSSVRSPTGSPPATLASQRRLSPDASQRVAATVMPLLRSLDPQGLASVLQLIHWAGCRFGPASADKSTLLAGIPGAHRISQGSCRQEGLREVDTEQGLRYSETGDCGDQLPSDTDRMPWSVGEAVLLNVARQAGVAEWSVCCGNASVASNGARVPSQSGAFCLRVSGVDTDENPVVVDIPQGRLQHGLQSGDDEVRMALLKVVALSRLSSVPPALVELELLSQAVENGSSRQAAGSTKAAFADAFKRLLQRARDAYRKQLMQQTPESIRSLLTPSSPSTRLPAGQRENTCNACAAPVPKGGLDVVAEVNSFRDFLLFLQRLHRSALLQCLPCMHPDRQNAGTTLLLFLYELWGSQPPTALRKGSSCANAALAAARVVLTDEALAKLTEGGCAVAEALGFYAASVQAQLVGMLASRWPKQSDAALRILKLFPRHQLEWGLSALCLSPQKDATGKGSGCNPPALQPKTEAGSLSQQPVWSLKRAYADVLVLIHSIRESDYAAGASQLELALSTAFVAPLKRMIAARGHAVTDPIRGMGDSNAAAKRSRMRQDECVSTAPVDCLPGTTLTASFSDVRETPEELANSADILIDILDRSLVQHGEGQTSSCSVLPGSVEIGPLRIACDGEPHLQKLFRLLNVFLQASQQRLDALEGHARLSAKTPNACIHGLLVVLSKLLRELPPLGVLIRAYSEYSTGTARAGRFRGDSGAGSDSGSQVWVPWRRLVLCLVRMLMDVCSSMFCVIAEGADSVMLNAVWQQQNDQQEAQHDEKQSQKKNFNVDCRGHPLLPRRDVADIEMADGEREDEEETEETLLAVRGWVTVKAASSCLSALLDWIPLEQAVEKPIEMRVGDRTRATKELEKQLIKSSTIITVGEMNAIGRRLLHFLLSCRHLGAMNSLFDSLAGLSRKLLCSPEQAMQGLPRTWIDNLLLLLLPPALAAASSRTSSMFESEAVSTTVADPSQFSASERDDVCAASLPPPLRKSASLGLAFVAVLAGEAASADTTMRGGDRCPLLQRAMSILVPLAEGRYDSMFPVLEEAYAHRAHCLNVIRAVIRSGSLSTSIACVSLIPSKEAVTALGIRQAAGAAPSRDNRLSTDAGQSAGAHGPPSKADDNGVAAEVLDANATSNIIGNGVPLAALALAAAVRSSNSTSYFPLRNAATLLLVAAVKRMAGKDNDSLHVATFPLYSFCSGAQQRSSANPSLAEAPIDLPFLQSADVLPILLRTLETSSRSANPWAFYSEDEGQAANMPQFRDDRGQASGQDTGNYRFKEPEQLKVTRNEYDQGALVAVLLLVSRLDFASVASEGPRLAMLLASESCGAQQEDDDADEVSCHKMDTRPSAACPPAPSSPRWLLRLMVALRTHLTGPNFHTRLLAARALANYATQEARLQGPECLLHGLEAAVVSAANARANSNTSNGLLLLVLELLQRPEVCDWLEQVAYKPAVACQHLASTQDAAALLSDGVGTGFERSAETVLRSAARSGISGFVSQFSRCILYVCSVAPAPVNRLLGLQAMQTLAKHLVSIRRSGGEARRAACASGRQAQGATCVNDADNQVEGSLCRGGVEGDCCSTSSEENDDILEATKTVVACACRHLPSCFSEVARHFNLPSLSNLSLELLLSTDENPPCSTSENACSLGSRHPCALCLVGGIHLPCSPAGVTDSSSRSPTSLGPRLGLAAPLHTVAVCALMDAVMLTPGPASPGARLAAVAALLHLVHGVQLHPQVLEEAFKCCRKRLKKGRVFEPPHCATGGKASVGAAAELRLGVRLLWKTVASALCSISEAPEHIEDTGCRAPASQAYVEEAKRKGSKGASTVLTNSEHAEEHTCPFAHSKVKTGFSSVLRAEALRLVAHLAQMLIHDSQNGGGNATRAGAVGSEGGGLAAVSPPAACVAKAARGLVRTYPCSTPVRKSFMLFGAAFLTSNCRRKGSDEGQEGELEADKETTELAQAWTACLAECSCPEAEVSLRRAAVQVIGFATPSLMRFCQRGTDVCAVRDAPEHTIGYPASSRSLSLVGLPVPSPRGSPFYCCEDAVQVWKAMITLLQDGEPVVRGEAIRVCTDMCSSLANSLLAVPGENGRRIAPTAEASRVVPVLQLALCSQTPTRGVDSSVLLQILLDVATELFPPQVAADLLWAYTEASAPAIRDFCAEKLCLHLAPRSGTGAGPDQQPGQDNVGGNPDVRPLFDEEQANLYTEDILLGQAAARNLLRLLGSPSALAHCCDSGTVRGCEENSAVTFGLSRSACEAAGGKGSVLFLLRCLARRASATETAGPAEGDRTQRNGESISRRVVEQASGSSFGDADTRLRDAMFLWDKVTKVSGEVEDVCICLEEVTVERLVWGDAAVTLGTGEARRPHRAAQDQHVEDAMQTTYDAKHEATTRVLHASRTSLVGENEFGSPSLGNPHFTQHALFQPVYGALLKASILLLLLSDSSLKGISPAAQPASAHESRLRDLRNLCEWIRCLHEKLEQTVKGGSAAHWVLLSITRHLLAAVGAGQWGLPRQSAGYHAKPAGPGDEGDSDGQRRIAEDKESAQIPVSDAAEAALDEAIDPQAREATARLVNAVLFILPGGAYGGR